MKFIQKGPPNLQINKSQKFDKINLPKTEKMFIVKITKNRQPVRTYFKTKPVHVKDATVSNELAK